jgi:hypothetical protein
LLLQIAPLVHAIGRSKADLLPPFTRKKKNRSRSTSHRETSPSPLSPTLSNPPSVPFASHPSRSSSYCSRRRSGRDGRASLPHFRPLLLSPLYLYTPRRLLPNRNPSLSQSSPFPLHPPPHRNRPRPNHQQRHLNPFPRSLASRARDKLQSSHLTRRHFHLHRQRLRRPAFPLLRPSHLRDGLYPMPSNVRPSRPRPVARRQLRQRSQLL